MYSSGLPVLYIVACLFYIMLYWVYKFLLFKFYQKTSRFNENLPIHSIHMIKYAIVYHMVIGGFMYTNSRILSETHLSYLQGFKEQLQKYLSLIDN